jgi:hypothetical protein
MRDEILTVLSICQYCLLPDGVIIALVCKVDEIMILFVSFLELVDFRRKIMNVLVEIYLKFYYLKNTFTALYF